MKPSRQARRAQTGATTSGPRLLICVGAAAMVIATGSACASDATSGNFRLIGSAPAGTSAIAVSPVYKLYVVGGSGQPVGISVSTNNSVVIGGTSNQLPTDRMFMDGLEN